MSNSQQYKISAEKYFMLTHEGEWSYSDYLDAMEPFFSKRAKTNTLKSTWKKRFIDHLREIKKDSVDEKKRAAATSLIKEKPKATEFWTQFEKKKTLKQQQLNTNIDIQVSTLKVMSNAASNQENQLSKQVEIMGDNIYHENLKRQSDDYIEQKKSKACKIEEAGENNNVEKQEEHDNSVPITLPSHEAQANDDLLVKDSFSTTILTAVQREPEAEQFDGKEEDAFLQEAVCEDESDNNGLCVKTICVRARMENWRKSSKYIPQLHKQDLLRYNIIDTIESSSTNSRNLFNYIWDEMINTMENMLIPTAETEMSDMEDDEVKDNEVKNDVVKTYAKNILKKVNTRDKLHKALKSERSKLRPSSNISNIQWKKRILTISKAFRDQFQNGRNAFINDQTEYHYIITFIYLVFKPLFKDFQHISIIWGEKSLLCSAILFNNSQQDSDRRNPGSKIDAIMKLYEVNLEFSVVEVSGPPKDPDHSHYIGDRNKIAKSLKIILNYIRKKYHGDFQRFRKIKVYGIQVYNNFFYIYSLSVPFSRVYYFKQELVFECLTNVILTFKMFPKFLSNLWKMRDIISSSAKAVTSYIESVDESDDDDGLDPVTISPPKRSTSKKKKN